MPPLICKRVTFYSQGDELSFFEFARRIKGIRKVEGVGDEIHIHISARLSDASLRDILGLFHRYKIEMRQLRRFETLKNRDWFRNKRSFGSKRYMTPNKSPQPTRITPLVLRFGFPFYHVTAPAWLSSGRWNHVP
jgi:hypothetical protein